MRIAIVHIFFLILFASLSSCAGLTESSFTIKVTGSSGMKFSGSYMSVTTGGSNTSKSVEGIVPEEFTITGSIVSCSFQKQSEGGFLKVEILKNGKSVSHSETYAAYGVVTAATQ
jgi:hypothetical protein